MKRDVKSRCSLWDGVLLSPGLELDVIDGDVEGADGAFDGGD